jgi:hypothetical protein
MTAAAVLAAREGIMRPSIFAMLIAAAIVASAAPASAQTAPGTAPAPRGAPSAAAPAAKREPTAGQMAARERQKKCGAEWKEAKAGGKTGGLKWPQYWHQCNARLKGSHV